MKKKFYFNFSKMDVDVLFYKINTYIRNDDSMVKDLIKSYNSALSKDQYSEREKYSGLKIAKLLYKYGLHKELLMCLSNNSGLFEYFYNDGDIKNILEYYLTTYFHFKEKNLKNEYVDTIKEIYTNIYNNCPPSLIGKFRDPLTFDFY